MLLIPGAMPEKDPFGVLCVALRIVSDADHHDRMTVADVAGVDLPLFNFCRAHERIETAIATVVRQQLASSPPATLASNPHCELQLLTLLTALGARIQLFNTAVVHGRKAKFLDPIVHECRQENASTAIDMSDLLHHAEVLRPDKVSVNLSWALLKLRFGAYNRC